ncbi:MAG: 50S ribosomal protein L2 [Planctomycetota bacterium]|nr:50S ribosomal protein L2 [Planctomycetota bacterium]MDA1141314.1 50S ribosomal protein L2 [Planctomycetota bacterium]
MPIKQFKPTTPSLRFTALVTSEGLSKVKPEKGLLRSIKKTGGRNNKGRITSRFRGGGHKRRYRLIDFKRNKDGIPAKVATIEYDPNRSARIALLHYTDGEKRYIIAPKGMEVGQMIHSGDDVEPKLGNSMPIAKIPQGVAIYNIEMQPGKGGQVCRSAGSFATIQAKEGKHALITMPSGEVRKVLAACRATIGQTGNLDHSAQSLGKAGRKRWLGRRPHVRGTAQNPVSHPMGGGEGRTAGGRHPCSPQGRPSKGGNTRRRGKSSDKLIVRGRKRSGK